MSFGQPMYVTKIDPVRNQVTLGPEGSQYGFRAGGRGGQLGVHSQTGRPGDIAGQGALSGGACSGGGSPMEDGTVEVQFETPQRSVTPGQAVGVL